MNWLSGDWYQQLNTPSSYLALVASASASALVCGAIIGTERERKANPAGLRTMILRNLWPYP